MTAAALAPPRRIGVLRALMLGDMLCAVPALRALAAHWPDAELVLVGLPWAAELAQRLPMVKRFVALPGWPGLPEVAPDLPALPGFLRQMQQLEFDLLLQLHGSGGIVNPLVAACAPRHSAGFVLPGGWCAEPALYTAWPEHGHEIHRLLALTDHLDVPRAGTALAWTVTEADRAELAQRLPALFDRTGQARAAYACIHPGARFSSRRWPARHFAAVADALAAQGLCTVLTGSAGERALAAEVAAQMRHRAVDACGLTGLGGLGALVAQASVVVCNDTGMSHVAVATGTPSVVVSSGSHVARWAPLDGLRHRLFWQDLPCRPCAHEDCPVEGHPCAAAVRPAEVVAAALAQAELAPLPVPTLEGFAA